MELLEVLENITISEDKLLEEIRQILDLTIKDFVKQMGWSNQKYYYFIRRGKRVNASFCLQKSRPTIFKVFNGINEAIFKYENWANKRYEIREIVIHHLLPIIKYLAQ